MAISLRFDKNLDECKETTLHLLPCKINADGPANVSTYFESYIRDTDDGHYEASFRGYPLEGKTIDVPAGYKGITFYERKKPVRKDEKRNLYPTAQFSKFTYWNYDKIPSDNDAIIGALNWIDIAEALHSTKRASSDNSTGSTSIE